MIRYTPYFRFCESPVSSLTVQYNKISGIQIAIQAINSNIAAEAMTMQDKHRPCQHGMFFRHNVQNKNDPSLSRAQRWMRREGTCVHQYACNYTESCHKKCVTLSPDVNSPVCKRSPDFLDLCPTVLQYKTKHSRGNIIKTRSDISHLRVQLVAFHNNRRTWERARQYSSIHQHGENLFAPDNRFRSSTDGSDCCCTDMINIDIPSRCPEVGRQRRPPTTVHV